jgi:RNA-directed DNA polymerase
MKNDGVPGVDGFEVESLKEDATVRAKWLGGPRRRIEKQDPPPIARAARLHLERCAKTKRRPLGIPTVKDRVVQTAVAILLQPIMEAGFTITPTPTGPAGIPNRRWTRSRKRC